MLEYLASSDPIVKAILSQKEEACVREGVLDATWSVYGTTTILTTEGKILSLPLMQELVSSITLIDRTSYFITTEGKLYFHDYGGDVTPISLPEPVVLVKGVGGCLFAFTEEGNLYYNLIGKKWKVIKGLTGVVKVIASITCIYLSTITGRWYMFMRGGVLKVKIVPLHSSITDIMIDDDEMVMATIGKERYCL